MILALLAWAGVATAVVVHSFRARRPYADIDTSHSSSEQPPDAHAKAGRMLFLHPVELFGLLLLAIPYHAIFSRGISLYGDWLYLGPQSSLASVLVHPSLWAAVNLGSSNFIGLPQYPLWGAESALAAIGASVSTAQLIIFLAPIPILAYVGTVRLARTYHLAPWACSVAALFYCTNTFFLDWYSGGWLTILLGYSLLPWVGLAMHRLYMATEAGHSRVELHRGGLALGVATGLTGWADPRDPILVSIGAATAGATVALAGRLDTRRFFRLAQSLAVALPIAVCLNLTWVIPALVGEYRGLPDSYTSASALATFSYMHLPNAVAVFDVWWPSMQYFRTQTATPLVAMAVPLLVLLAVVRRGRIGPLCAGAIYVVFAALVCGASPPFALSNEWLYQNVPGLDAFRYPALYEPPVALSASLLLAIGFSHAAAFLRALWIGATHLVSARGRVYGALTLALTGLVIPYAVASPMPAITGRLGHMLSPEPLATSVRTLEAYFTDKSAAGTVAWAPGIPDSANQNVVSSTGAMHPNVSATLLLHESPGSAEYQAGSLNWLATEGAAAGVLQYFHVRYVVLDPANQWRARYGVARRTAQITLGELGTRLPVGSLGAEGYAVYAMPGGGVYQVLTAPHVQSSVGALDADSSGSAVIVPPLNLRLLSMRVESGILAGEAWGDAYGAARYSFTVAPPSIVGVVVYWYGHYDYVSMRSLQRGVSLPFEAARPQRFESAEPVFMWVPATGSPAAPWSAPSQCQADSHVLLHPLPLPGGDGYPGSSFVLLQAQAGAAAASATTPTDYRLAAQGGATYTVVGQEGPADYSAVATLVPRGTYAVSLSTSLFARSMPTGCRLKARLLSLSGPVALSWIPVAIPRTSGLTQYRAFSAAVGPWESLGDGDNYTGARSLAAAGISAREVPGPKHSSALCLNASTDGATVSAPWSDLYGVGVLTLRLKYAAAPGALVTVSLFRSGAVLSSVEQYFGATASTEPVEAASVVFLPPSNFPNNQYTVALSAIPARSAHPSPKSRCLATIFGLLVTPGLAPAGGLGMRPGPSHVIAAAADEVETDLAPSSGGQLVALWQHYDPLWHLVLPNGRTVRPILLDGWAVGFPVGAHRHPIRVLVQYGSPLAVQLGLYLSYVVLGACVLLLGVLRPGRVRRL